MKHYYLLLSLILMPLMTLSQELVDPSVRVIGRATEKSILLRWAVDQPAAWQMANDNGYVLERYTIMRDSVLLSAPERTLLTPEPLMPESPENWEPLVEENDFVAVAAQALFGEAFELSTDYANDIAQIVNKSKEIERRFSFALFAADHSLEVPNYPVSILKIEPQRKMRNISIEYSYATSRKSK